MSGNMDVVIDGNHIQESLMSLLMAPKRLSFAIKDSTPTSTTNSCRPTFLFLFLLLLCLFVDSLSESCKAPSVVVVVVVPLLL